MPVDIGIIQSTGQDIGILQSVSTNAYQDAFTVAVTVAPATLGSAGMERSISAGIVVDGEPSLGGVIVALSFTLASTYSSSYLTMVDGVASLPVTTNIGAALSALAAYLDALTLDAEFDGLTEGSRGKDGSITVGTVSGVTLASHLAAIASLTHGLTISSPLIGFKSLFETLDASVELDVPEAQFGYAASFEFGTEHDLSFPGVVLAAAGFVNIATSWAYAGSAQVSGRNSISLGVTIPSPFTGTEPLLKSNVGYGTSIAAGAIFTYAAVGARLYQNSFDLALEADAIVAARLAYRVSLPAGVSLSAILSPQSNLSEDFSVQASFATLYPNSLQAQAAVSLGAVFASPIIGGRLYQNDLGISLAVLPAFLPTTEHGGPGIFLPDGGGIPSIFAPVTIGDTPGIFKPDQGGTPGIFIDVDE